MYPLAPAEEWGGAQSLCISVIGPLVGRAGFKMNRQRVRRGTAKRPI